MKRLALVLVVLCAVAVAQDYSSVTAINIADIAGDKLASGELCFQATDQTNRPINFKLGSGGQTITAPKCTAITNGAIGSFQVANPGTTSPSGIWYRVTARSKTGEVVIDYKGVTWSGATFNLDAYVPQSGVIPAPAGGDAKSFRGKLLGTAAPTDGQGYFYNAVSGEFELSSPGAASVPDATSTVKGKIQLAGDLGGTAASPTVSADWANVRNKPTTFTPDSHTHIKASITDFPLTWPWADISGKPSTFPPDSHTHLKSAITDFPTTWAWASLSGVPSTFAPSSHTHPAGEVTSATDGCGQFVSGVLTSTGTSCGTGTGGTTDHAALSNLSYAASGHTGFAPSSHNHASGEVTGLATVATSGSYNDLLNKPTIPAAQVNSDWSAVSGVAQILNKPTLSTVATSGSYNDLSNKPTIPTNLNQLATRLFSDLVSKPFACEIHVGAPNGSALVDGDDEPISCYNDTGSTVGLTAVRCYADAGSPTVMVKVTGGLDMLTGNLTCGTAAWASGTLIVNPNLANNGTLDVNIISAGGTAKYIRVVISGAY